MALWPHCSKHGAYQWHCFSFWFVKLCPDANMSSRQRWDHCTSLLLTDCEQCLAGQTPNHSGALKLEQVNFSFSENCGLNFNPSKRILKRNRECFNIDGMLRACEIPERITRTGCVKEEGNCSDMRRGNAKQLETWALLSYFHPVNMDCCFCWVVFLQLWAAYWRKKKGEPLTLQCMGHWFHERPLVVPSHYNNRLYPGLTHSHNKSFHLKAFLEMPLTKQLLRQCLPMNCCGVEMQGSGLLIFELMKLILMSCCSSGELRWDEFRLFGAQSSLFSYFSWAKEQCYRK